MGNWGYFTPIPTSTWLFEPTLLQGHLSFALVVPGESSRHRVGHVLCHDHRHRVRLWLSLLGRKHHPNSQFMPASHATYGKCIKYVDPCFLTSLGSNFDFDEHVTKFSSSVSIACSLVRWARLHLRKGVDIVPSIIELIYLHSYTKSFNKKKHYCKLVDRCGEVLLLNLLLSYYCWSKKSC